jgi:ankyrin repeat protein
MTSIRLAALSNHNTVLEHLLDGEGMHVNAMDEAGRTAFYWGSELGHHEVVRVLLDRGADVKAQGGYYGSALQAATARSHDKIVQVLLDSGADVNAQGGHYGNALQEALAKGHVKIVQLLLNKGAGVNVGNIIFATVFDIAIRSGCTDVL